MFLLVTGCGVVIMVQEVYEPHLYSIQRIRIHEIISKQSLRPFESVLFAFLNSVLLHNAILNFSSEKSQLSLSFAYSGVL